MKPVMHPPQACAALVASLLLCSATDLEAQPANDGLMRAIAAADVIVQAEVTDVQARWEGGLVISTVSAHVTSCLRGRCASEHVWYDVPGGEVDGVAQVVSGFQVPRRRQSLVLLLEWRTSRLQPVSLTHGVLSVGSERPGQQVVRLPGLQLSIEHFRSLIREVGQGE